MTQLSPIDWSEEILEEIFRNTSVGFVLIDLHGTIIEINEAFASMLGRERTDIAGKQMSRFVLDEDRDLTDTLLSQLCEGEIGGYDIHRHYVKPGGRSLATKVTASVIRSKDAESICAIELVEDIDARLHAEEALRESELRYRRVVEDQTDFIVRWLPNGTRIFVNDAYCRYLEMPREKILGTSLFPTIAKEDRAAFRRRIAHLSPENPVTTNQHRVALRGRDIRWHEWTDRGLFDETGALIELQSVGRDVTEHRLAEDALLKSELKYRRLFDEIPIAVWVADWTGVLETLQALGLNDVGDLIDLSQEGGRSALLPLGDSSRVLEINAVARRLFGITENGEFSGRLARLLTPESWRRLVRTAAPLIFDHEDSASVELTCERSDGTTFDILTRWSRTEPRDSSWNFIVSAIDMTERNSIEKDLEAQRRLLEQAEAIARLGSWEWDAKSDVIRGSAEFGQILGRPEMETWTADEFMKRVHQEDLRDVMSSLSRVPSGGIGKALEFRIVTPSGTVKHVRSQGYLARDQEGALSGGFGMLQDISEQKEAERIAEHQREELVRADKMISLGTLVSGVAHEINNPNHFIMLNAPFLRDVWRDARPALEAWASDHPELELAGLKWEEIATEVPEILEEIEQGTERIRGIVAELKNFARDPEQGMASSVSINDAVAAAIRLISRRVSHTTPNFEVRYGEDLPLILANQQKLEQVVINLVLNSCEALGRSEGAIRVVTGSNDARDRVIVTVEDEGSGITEEAIGRILDPFFTTKRADGGTGLGLAVSHRIVKEHGGELEFSSEPGIGTRASMILPVSVSDRVEVGDE